MLRLSPTMLMDRRSEDPVCKHFCEAFSSDAQKLFHPDGGSIGSKPSVNAIRTFGGFDFTRLAGTALGSRKAQSTTMFRLWRPPGTPSALSLSDVRKARKAEHRKWCAARHLGRGFHSRSVSSKAAGPGRVLDLVESAMPDSGFRASGTGRRLGRKSQGSQVDADNSLDLSLCYDIQSVPSLLCFIGGSPRWRIVGTAKREAIEAKLKPFSQ